MRKITKISLPLLLIFTTPSILSQTHMQKQGSLDFPTDSITKFNYYSYRKLIIVSPTKITEYEAGPEFKKTQEAEHNIPNLKESYIKAKMDRSGTVFIAAGDYLLSFSATLGYEQIGNYSKTSFGKEIQENFTGFSKVMDFNDYQSYMALMTNNSYLFEMKYFREKIFTYQVSTQPRTKTGTITYMSYVKYGSRLATFFEDKTLVLYLTNWPNYGKATVSNYKFDETPLNIGQCDEVGLFAVLVEKKVLFFDNEENKLIKEFEFSEEDVKDNPLISCRSPTGTKVLLVFSPKKIFFIDLETLERITIQEIPKASPETWLYFLSGTNYFLTEEPIEKKNEGNLRYTAYEFTMKDSRFCHKTCGSDCKINFQPCSIFNKLFTYLLWISGVLIGGAILCFSGGFAINSYKKRGEKDGIYNRSTTDLLRFFRASDGDKKLLIKDEEKEEEGLYKRDEEEEDSGFDSLANGKGGNVIALDLQDSGDTEFSYGEKKVK